MSQVTLPLFGNNITLQAAMQDLSAKADEAMRAIQPDAHPTARVASRYFLMASKLTAMCLMGYGATWGALLLLDGDVTHIVVGVVGGIVLWKIIRRIEPIIERFLGPEPDYTPYKAMRAVNCAESEIFKVAPIGDPMIRIRAKIANKPYPSGKTPFEKNVVRLAECGVMADKKYHSAIARFLVQARCQIALNYIPELICGSHPLQTKEGSELLKRIQKRAKKALDQAAHSKVKLSEPEQKVLQLWAGGRNYELNLKVRESYILDRAMSEHPAQQSIPYVSGVTDLRDYQAQIAKQTEDLGKWVNQEDPKTVEGLRQLTEIRETFSDPSKKILAAWRSCLLHLTN
jgi:hypothetical protein